MGVAVANNEQGHNSCLLQLPAGGLYKGHCPATGRNKIQLFFVMPIETGSAVKSKAGIPLGRLQQ